jgi:hypothetical protein
MRNRLWVTVKEKRYDNDDGTSIRETAIKLSI